MPNGNFWAIAIENRAHNFMIALHLNTDHLPAINLAKINIIDTVKTADRSHSPLSENAIKSIAMISHMRTPGILKNINYNSYRI